MAPSVVCILGAMEEEMREFFSQAVITNVVRHQAFTIHEGTLFGVAAVMVKCGVGKVFASLITQSLIDAYRPSAIISTGVAGALSENLRIGDVVVSRDCVQHDMDARAIGFERGRIPYTDYRFFAADEKLVQRALSCRLESARHQIVAGRIVTGDQFIAGARGEVLRYLTAELNGDAVDMESAAIAQVCCVNATPFVSIRTLSDNADHSAHLDFHKFLPLVAQNSFHIVKHLLSPP